MHHGRTSDPGPVTAYKLQSSPGRKHSLKSHPWDFPGSAPTHSGVRSSGREEVKRPSKGRRSTAAFADHDYFTRPSLDVAHVHDDRRVTSGLGQIERDSKTLGLHEVISAEDIGYPSVPLTTTIYVAETHGLPDWYVELNATQMVVFQKILNMLDARELSALDRTELFDLLKEVIDDLTLSQVNQAIDDLEGQGRVDFDEFLYALAEGNTTTAEEEEEEQGEEGEDGQAAGRRKGKDKRKYSLLTKIFYSAIASFSVIGAVQSPLELQRKHKLREGQGPHLLAHFLQSRTRKWGKSKKVLEATMKKMLHNARGQFSPYIHPLPFVRIGKRHRDPPHQCPRQKITHPEDEEDGGDGGFRPSVVASIKIQELSPVAMAAFHKMSLAAAADQEEEGEPVAEKEEIYLDENDINYVLDVYADHGSVAARLPDIQLVPGMRQTLARISIYDPLCSSDRKRRQTMKLLRNQMKKLDMEDPRVRLMRQRKDRIKFFMPHVPRFTVPIPKFRPTTCEMLHVTPINLANMTKRINSKLEDYRLRLKISHMKHAWKLLGRLPLNDLPAGNRERFLQVFRAYQPLRLRDIYVISPYIPHISYLG